MNGALEGSLVCDTQIHTPTPTPTPTYTLPLAILLLNEKIKLFEDSLKEGADCSVVRYLRTPQRFSWCCRHRGLVSERELIAVWFAT
jgi:hypothetical protein